jgi:hypothetical protein
VTVPVYTLVFDATNAPLPWGVLWEALIFVGIGAVLWLTRNRVWPWERTAWKTRPAGRTWFAGLWLGFALFAATSTSIGAFRSVFSARRALRDGTARVVDGPVLNFHPMPYEGHDTERFTVRDVAFEYSGYESSPASFHHARSHGGPITEGVFVRIHYDGSLRDARILKLEVRR